MIAPSFFAIAAAGGSLRSLNAGGAVDPSLTFVADPLTWPVDLDIHKDRRVQDISTLSEFNRHLLLQHNVVRCLFGTAPVAWNTRMELGSEDAAHALVGGSRYKTFMNDAATSELDPTVMGENISERFGGLMGATYSAGDWMNEYYENNFDGRSHGYINGRYHGARFTQMIWAGSREIACTHRNDYYGTNDLVVCKYYPVGNSWNGDANLVDKCVNSLEKCEAEFNHKLDQTDLGAEFMQRCKREVDNGEYSGPKGNNSQYYKNKSKMFGKA